MIHDPLHYEHVAAQVGDLQRRYHGHARPDVGHPRRAPGRVRRRAAVALVRVAERLAHQPASAIPRGM